MPSMTDVSHDGAASRPHAPGQDRRRSGTSPRENANICAAPRFARFGACCRWALAVLACLWMALCTAVGPLYWREESIADWGRENTVYAVLSFAVYLGIVVALVRLGSGAWSWRRAAARARERWRPHLAQTAAWRGARRALAPARRVSAVVGRILRRGTDRWWKLLLIFVIGWLWIPTTLVTAFGADIRSQIREFSWAWNQWTGIQQPYIGFFSFVPMDIYPTAHYLWPEDPTYLTDQHNIVLTVCYGAVASVSRYLTGSNDAGYVALSALQYLFAAFCCAATADRFLNLGFMRRYAGEATSRRGPARGGRLLPQSPRRRSRPLPTIADQEPIAPAGGLARFLILLFFMTCPLAVFATISLTKSPLFAFAFVWWFGVWYELHATRGQLQRDGLPVRLSRRSLAAFVAASCVMLVSAKYAWYILAAQIVLALIADRRRWRTYAAALLLPTVIIHGGVSLLIGTGAIITGDPIESRGIQLQQIARVAKLNPDGIPESAREKLEPIFNLDQTAEAYDQDDADPVKSSGIQSKKVSYKWRTVTAEDMERFNAAWLEIVAANPVIALDAFLAKCYGYFDVTAPPYTSMDYYVDSTYVQDQTTWIKDWCHEWRDDVAQFARDWGAVPVLGWFTHGNLYVSLTLLVGAAEVVLRRWRTLMWHMPLLLLMGVMVTAPANNFERHMLPVAFVFGFLCLTFIRDRAATAARGPGVKVEA